MISKKYTTNFETIQKGIYFNYDWGEGTTWPWQTFQNLNHDMFSGYFHDFASKFSDKKYSICIRGRMDSQCVELYL